MKDATGVWFEDHSNKLLFPIPQKNVDIAVYVTSC